MNFSSSLFLLYFLPVFLLVYFISGKRFIKIITIGASLIFFAWGAPSFLFLLLASVIIDFHLAHVMHASTGKPRKTMLVFLLVLNIGLLGYFKYTGFFLSQFNQILSWFKLSGVEVFGVMLPVGISFIIFQKISYLIDVYRGTAVPAKKLSDYTLFILFFPKILAGPIVRYNDFSSGLSDQKKYSAIEDRLTGFFRFSLGLAKKVMIANVLGGFADEIFATEANLLNTKTAWLGTLTYSFQIYFNFSAYSDMAIGLSRMIGFRLAENFNNPYVSVGITGFWKRWHITLGTWLRDYLFLPLAYTFSRRMPKDKYLGVKTDHWLYIFATLLTMVICGFWHGAGWTFILWGFYHGSLLALERLFLMRLLKKSGRIPAIAFTFLAVIVGWVLFRSESVSYAIDFYSVMFSFNNRAADFMITPQLTILLITSGIFAFAAIFKKVERWQMRIFTGINSLTGLIILTISSVLLFILGLSQVTATGFNPFIYFRF